MLAETIFLRRKDNSTRKKLGCKFIRINTSKKGYDPDYESGSVQTFVRIKQENKRIRRQNKKA